MRHRDLHGRTDVVSGVMIPRLGEPAERRGAVTLPGGRTLAWHEWGPIGGHPVLFCTGAAMSGALGFGLEVVDRLGVRLIAIDRPGLGSSSPHAGKSLTSWTSDVRAMLGAEAIARPRAVGFSQGAPFALALGAAGLVEAVTLVSAQDDFGHDTVAAMLPAPVAGMVQLARTSPAELACDVASVASAAWLLDLVVQTSSDVDRALYASAPFVNAYARCLADGFRQGANGYVQDLLIALGPWPFAVEDVRVPVHIWYGAHDASPVHSPDHGATLASRLPRATRTVLDDAGGSLLWTHAQMILAPLLVRED